MVVRSFSLSLSRLTARVVVSLSVAFDFLSQRLPLLLCAALHLDRDLLPDSPKLIAWDSLRRRSKG